MADTAEEWADNAVDVGTLRLDLQNPRLPQHVKDHNDETQIRNYLLGKEGILRVARSIANNGYHRSAVSIVYKEGDKYVVLDGNRRLAACQLLANPALVPNAKDKKEVETLAAKLTPNALSSIKIAIAPSRKVAEKEIWDIHVTPLSKPWEVLQKLRMYRNLIDTGDYTIKTASHEYGITENKFKTELTQLYFYEKILALTDSEGEEQLLKSGFNKIQRLILSTNGHRLLDYITDDMGNVSPNDDKRFNAMLALLVPYITNPKIIPAQATQEDLEDIAYSKVDPVMFPPKKKEAVSKGPGAATTTKPGLSTSAAPTTPVPQPNGVQPSGGTNSLPDWISDGEFKAYQGATRVKNILEELKKNRPTKKQNLNIVAVSLRVVVELAIYDKLSSRGSITAMVNAEKARIKAENAARVAKGSPILTGIKSDWTPSLKEMLSFMAIEANGVITDPQERRALTRLITTQKDFIDDLNSFVHNPSFTPTESAVKEIWEHFCRLIFDILKKI